MNNKKKAINDLHQVISENIPKIRVSIFFIYLTETVLPFFHRSFGNTVLEVFNTERNAR